MKKAILTGDIANSRSVHPETWLPGLKTILNSVGKEPSKWEIFRGDSFQVETSADDALTLALKIKASVKTHRELDVRQSIGIGSIDYKADKITESNGTAFTFSGDNFDKKNIQKLILKSDDDEFDATFDVILKLIGHIADDWKPATAETILQALSHPNLTQKELAKKMEKSAATVNGALKRGGYPEILQAIELFKNRLK